MRVIKKSTHHLSKCYSVALLQYNNKEHVLVAAEKTDACLLFDLCGTMEEVIWDQPGGTMSMVQFPESNGVFLATHQFYSPNDSKEAKIVMASPEDTGKWSIRTLVDLPFVHRFDILTRNNVHYLIGATLCSNRRFKDDWSSPGKVYVCELPENLSTLDEIPPLKLTVIKDGLLKNHGYCRADFNGVTCGIIGCDNGVYQMVPPDKKGEEWQVIKLLDHPVSDMTFVDFDGDGELEMLTISPFHGDRAAIYKQINGTYEEIYVYKRPIPFAHGIWSGELCGEPTVVLGHRQGERDLIAITCIDKKNLIFAEQILDHNVGTANVLHYKNKDKDYLVAANREIDEIAFYELAKD